MIFSIVIYLIVSCLLYAKLCFANSLVQPHCKSVSCSGCVNIIADQQVLVVSTVHIKCKKYASLHLY
uniref:Secreted protein n=1 Tax=Arundo donax TaxID=35708 RepID=A0A0A9ECK4_ARUDO